MINKPSFWSINVTHFDEQYNDYFSTSDEKYFIVYKGLVEYGMLKLISHVEIWTDQNNPKCVFNSTDVWFEHQGSESCYYLEDSKIIILMVHCMQENSRYFKLLYVLFNFEINQFALLESTNFYLIENADRKIELQFYSRYFYRDADKQKFSKYDRKKFSLDNLIWYEMKDIVNACSLKYNSLDEIIVTT